MDEALLTLLPVVRDLGLPTVALYFIFKAYQERIKKNDEREDKYVDVLERHSRDCGLLAESLKTLSQEIRAETAVRQTLLNKLVDKALESSSESGSK